MLLIHQYDDYDSDYFENCLQQEFTIRKKIDLNEGRRTLYYCVRQIAG